MSFGDIRVAERADWLIERVAATGTLVLRKLGETRAGEKAVHRFLSSPYVSVERLVETVAARTAVQCAGQHILAVQDTTEINFSGRDKKRRGFGPGGNGKTPGFFIHPVIAIDVATEAVVGLVDAAIWTRARVTMVSDRESDIYQLFACKPARLDLIVRASQDRGLAEGGLLFAALAQTNALCSGDVRVAPRGPGDKGRIAKVEQRAATERNKRRRSSSRSWKRARSMPRATRLRCCGACSQPCRSPPPRRPTRLFSSIACAGASSRCFVRSKATGLR